MEEKRGINKLPQETLVELFGYLQGDSRSLFSCLQVCRIWCRLVVPLLWSYPLRFGFVRRDKAQGQFIESLLACLGAEDRREIECTGIRLSPLSAFVGGTPSLPPLTAKRAQQRLLFDYAKYIREFDFIALDFKVQDWYHKLYKVRQSAAGVAVATSPREENKRIAAVTTALSKLIFTRSNVLTTFWLTKRDEKLSTQSIPDFIKFPNVETTLARLERLYLQTNFDEFDEDDAHNVNYLLTAMRLLSRNIGHLEIDFIGDDASFQKQVVELIRVQKSLKRIAFVEITSEYTSSITALQNQAESLRCVEFRNAILEGVSLEPLAQCRHLETLIFDNCDHFSPDIWKPLLLSYLPPSSASTSTHNNNNTVIRLKNLHFRDNRGYGDETDLIQLIQQIGPNLQELQLLQSGIHPDVLHSVAKCCPNFTSLDVLADPTLNTAIVHILTSCNQLTYFSLRSDDSNSTMNENFMSDLASLFPTSVRHVNLYCNVTPTALREFLRLYARPLRKVGLLMEQNELLNGCLEVLVNYAISDQANRDLVIGVDEHALHRCDDEVVRKLKTMCRYVYVDHFQVPSF